MDIKSHGTTAAPTGKTTSLQNADSKKTAEFDGVLSPSATPKATQTEKVSELMGGLQELAKGIKEGKVTKEEASRQFVGMVIQQQTHLKPHVKDVKKMETAVADAIEQDPFFVAKLETQLKKLSQES